jgi:hypothetical protein
VNCTVSVVDVCPTTVKSVTVVGRACTVNVASITCGLLLATADVTGTAAVYVPAARLPVAGCSVTVVGAVVPLKLAPNQPVGCPVP